MSDLSIMESIARLVPHGSRVLDLGCGDGAMLDYLQRHRGCSGYGIEISDANVLACVQPVSYTHLDVYKRQQLHYGPKQCAKSKHLFSELV